MQSMTRVWIVYQIREPHIDIFEHGGSIVGAVMTLLSNEQAPNHPKSSSLYTEALEGGDVLAALH